MVSMGIVQARAMVGEIRKAAQDFIACATEYHDDPSLVAEYIDGIDDRITKYVRACCAIEEHAMREVPVGKRGVSFGCGELSYGPEVLNVDIRPTSIVDVIADLNDYPWPIASSWAEYIYLTDIYEHLREAYLPLEECWRILKPEGNLFIRTSYWKSENSYTCPDHLRFCTLHTMDFWDKRTPFGQKYAFFSQARFEILTAEVSGEELSFTLKKEALDDGSWDIKSRYPKRRYYA